MSSSTKKVFLKTYLNEISFMFCLCYCWYMAPHWSNQEFRQMLAMKWNQIIQKVKEILSNTYYKNHLNKYLSVLRYFVTLSLMVYLRKGYNWRMDMRYISYFYIFFWKWNLSSLSFYGSNSPLQLSNLKIPRYKEDVNNIRVRI